MALQVPVLICGGGPVGLALAVELGSRNIQCTLVERGDGNVTVPKMSQVSTRSMEFCRRWGIADEVKRAGWPETHPADFIYLTTMTGHEIFRQRFASYSEQGDLGYTPEGPRQCPQIFFDPILLRRARSLPSVMLCHRAEIESFEAGPDGVQAQVKFWESGDSENISAAYLVGCDGFDGIVRKGLNTQYEGSGLLSYSLSIFFRSKSLGELHDKGWGRFYRLVDGSGHWSDLVAIDGRELWRLTLFQLDPDTDADSFDVTGALIRAVGKPFSYEVLSVLPWKRRELVAKSYGAGRVFIAGDAAHQMSPTGGLGMNTGIGDAVDLGWKLAAMLEGWGGARLLQSYELERKPVATASVLASSDVFQYETTLPSNPAIADDSPEGETARRQLAEALKGRRGAGNERLHESVKLGYRYDSLVIVPESEKTMPNSETFSQLCRSGARAPHAWIREGFSTLDLFGDGFVLLKFGNDSADANKIVEAAAARKVPLTVQEIKDANTAALYESALVLVRPDGHVAWRGDACPEDAVSLIDQVRGAQESLFDAVEARERLMIEQALKEFRPKKQNRP